MLRLSTHIQKNPAVFGHWYVQLVASTADARLVLVLRLVKTSLLGGGRITVFFTFER
jgi:lipid-A-disaccharide synthase-like uncharacterized protein